jgi:hypothetical protein
MSESIVKAIVVGDGFIDQKGRIRIIHAISQREYALYKARVLEEQGFKVSWREFIGNTGYNKQVPGKFIEVATTATTRGKLLRQIFYPNNQKVLPEFVLKEFGWPEWAIIYQDNGRANRISHYNTINQGERVRVECEPFVNRYEIALPTLDVEAHQNILANLQNLNVQASIQRRSDGQLRISISKSCAKIAFFEGVRPYIHETMLYKVEVKPTLSYSIVRD